MIKASAAHIFVKYFVKMDLNCHDRNKQDLHFFIFPENIWVVLLKSTENRKYLDGGGGGVRLDYPVYVVDIVCIL